MYALTTAHGAPRPCTCQSYCRELSFAVPPKQRPSLLRSFVAFAVPPKQCGPFSCVRWLLFLCSVRLIAPVSLQCSLHRHVCMHCYSHRRVSLHCVSHPLGPSLACLGAETRNDVRARVTVRVTSRTSARTSRCHSSHHPRSTYLLDRSAPTCSGGCVRPSTDTEALGPRR